MYLQKAKAVGESVRLESSIERKESFLKKQFQCLLCWQYCDKSVVMDGEWGENQLPLNQSYFFIKVSFSPCTARFGNLNSRHVFLERKAYSVP